MNLPTQNDIWLSLLKGGAKRKYRDVLGSVVKDYINTVFPVSFSKVDASYLEIVNDLEANGLASIPSVFSEDEVDELVTILKSLPVEYIDATTGRQVEHGFLSSQSEERMDIHYARYSSCDLAKIPLVAKLLSSIKTHIPAILYFGCLPTLSTVNCWWSFPGRKTAGAQNFHQDRGDFASLNMFVYLTDVDLCSGPHVFCRKTHKYSHLVTFLDQNPTIPKNEFWEWWEVHRKTDKSVHSLFNPFVITGKAGTSFLEDTNGLHKGLAPTDNKRLCFELVWTLLPQFNSTLKPVNIGLSSAHPVVKAINRLVYA